ncbi:MAG: DUF2917 domain-containing protein [Burkholderiales bacterium]|nr:DUF2917 domain-containing protein [Burkholderiales bacterium]
MNPSTTHAITLSGHQMRRLSTPARVRTESGLLWITVDGRPEDILLAAGESRRFERDERVIVYALGGEARFQVSAQESAQESARPARGPAHSRGWADRFARALSRRGASAPTSRTARRFISWLRGAPPTLGSGA